MEPRSFSYHSMGTVWEVTIWDAMVDDRFAQLRKEIIHRSQMFDETYSRFMATSLVSRIANTVGVVEVPNDFMRMLSWYRDLYLLADKKLNPLIGNMLSDLGYDASYSLTKKERVRRTPDLHEIVRIIDETHIELREPVLFDFGALGKGYFVDAIADFMQTERVVRFLVNGSGDIRYQSAGETIQVGLEDPRDPKKVIGVVRMTNGAMCSSSINRRAWEGRHHIVDPHSGSSTVGALAVWVSAKTAVLADALATCLFFVPPSRFEAQFEFDYCIMNWEGRVKQSRGFEVQLF